MSDSLNVNCIFLVCMTLHHILLLAMSDEKRLIKYLLENYERVGIVGRPVYNTSETVHVSFGLALIQILDLDEPNQVLTINAWERYVSLKDSDIIVYILVTACFARSFKKHWIRRPNMFLRNSYIAHNEMVIAHNYLYNCSYLTDYTIIQQLSILCLLNVT